MKNVFKASLLFLVLGGVSCKEKRYADPLSPEKALESFHLREGFKIETFAAEPYVYDPVEMVFDEQGNAYVVEMPDYPFKPEPGKEAGRIRLLIDTDGDGRIDKTTIFADSLSEATSILPWKGGLLVTSAPYILYFKDTTHDFRADVKEKLFTGFFKDNSEAQITNLRFGVDNWIYASNFGMEGTVKFNRKPDVPALSMRGADFRFRLDRGEFELTSGGAQFGQTMDDWGHRFITQNTLHIRHVVMPWYYLHRHPFLPSTESVVNVSDHDLVMFQLTPPPYWRAERTRRRQKEFDEKKLDRTEYAEDHFSGASGGTVYTGDAFPKEYYGTVFTGEVMGNLVHRDILSARDDSPTFIASRDPGEKDREFLASTDPWFRPANFTTGPDGNLYVIDMYRQHIETPLSIPEDLKADMDFLNGSEYGRIYRISPEKSAANKNPPNLQNLETKEYVNLLTHPNQWWRLQAQRLILERQDVSVVPLLKKLFTTHEDPRTRLHAFYALEGLHALDTQLVLQAMMDPHPGVREHGIIFSEHYPGCLPQLLKMTGDNSTRVSFQACLSVGEFSNKQVLESLAGAMEKHGEDPWFQTAVLSSEAGSSIPLLETLIRRNSFFKEANLQRATFLEQFSFVAGARKKDGELTQLLNLLSNPALRETSWKQSALTGLTKGLGNSESKPKTDARLQQALQKLAANPAPEIKKAVAELTSALK